ncbi:hypothetical protein OCD64_22900, partial [Bacillus toyonensis]|nr:hypothetical protein [Bacillus toyonensis]
MINAVYILIFWVLILFPTLYIIKIKKWTIKATALFLGRILLSIVYFINGMVLGLQRNWVEPPYETGLAPFGETKKKHLDNMFP